MIITGFAEGLELPVLLLAGLEDPTVLGPSFGELRLEARWDPAKGSPDGDFTAIVVLARDRHGYGYVVEAWLRKAKPSEQVEAAWVLASKWQLPTIVLESNGFQDLVAQNWPRQRKERREAGLWWQTAVQLAASTTDKEERIASLEPATTAHWVQFAEHLTGELSRQFQQFPTADHDDGPDAVQAAWANSGGSPPRMGQERVR